MTWDPDWRITIDGTVYTNVQSLNLTVGRIDIDRQCQAGYARVELVNTGTTAFNIDVTDALKLEVKDSTGTYVDLFGGEVSDFSISARSPDTTGFLTIGSVLAVGQLAKLPKALWTGALTQDLDGAQLADIFTSLTSLTTGEVDAGAYEMIARNADPIVMADITTLIADSGIGQIYEDKQGRVCFADADHRSNYLATNGYTELDADYAYPSSIRSIVQIGKIVNDISVDYNNGYASNLTDSDTSSISTYGLFSRKFKSNIKHAADMADLANRELTLRATPRSQLDSITFRLDSPDISNTLRDNLLNIFFGQPILLKNLPSNILDGEFEGFVEGWTMTGSPSRVDLKIYISPAAYSLPVVYPAYTLGQTITTAGTTTYTVPSGVSQIAVLAKAYGGNGGDGAAASGVGGAGGSGGGGAGAAAFWNYDVTPGATYSVNLDFTGTKRVSFGTLISVSSGANGSAGGSSAAAGGLYSVDPAVIFYTSQAGTASGAGGAAKTTNGNGNAGGSTGSGTTLTLPANVGLPTNFTSGRGGGGGGSGARDSTGINFYNGGAGGNPSGGNGGAAVQDGNLGGSNASSVSGTGNGGAGGGGGAYQLTFGNGAGGLKSDGSGAVVYVYTR